MRIIMILSIAFTAAEWGSVDVRFGVTILGIAFIAFLLGAAVKLKRLSCDLGHTHLRRLELFGRVYERPCPGEYWKPYKWGRVR